MSNMLRKILFAGIPFGITIGICISIFSNILNGIITGVLAGMFFGVGINLFVSYKQAQFEEKKSEIVGDKDIVVSGAANHFLNKESVGGWLCLTSDEIIFKSHTLNIQNHKLIISLSKIAAVEKCYTLRIVPNGMKIITTNGDIERFVVNERETWIKNIRTRMEKGKPGIS
jgi:hypothetical protein